MDVYGRLLTVPNFENHIELIYCAANNPDYWPEVLSAIQKSIDARSAMLGIDDVSNYTPLSAVRVGLVEDEKSLLASVGNRDIWTKALIDSGYTQFAPDHALLPYQQFLDSELFQDFAKPVDIYHTVGAYIDSRDSLSIRISFQRGKSQGAYDNHVVSYLDKLLPHIKNAVRLTKRIGELEAKEQLSTSLNSKPGDALILCNTARQCVYKNTEAEMLLSANQLIKENAGHLTMIGRYSGHSLQCAIQSLTRPIFGADFRSSTCHIYSQQIANKTKQYLIKLSHFSHNSAAIKMLDGLGSAGSLALIQIRDLDLSNDVNEPLLNQYYLLTPAEVEICQLIVNGASTAAIAEFRNRSESTVKTQIKNIMQKLNIHTQQKLIRFLNATC